MTSYQNENTLTGINTIPFHPAFLSDSKMTDEYKPEIIIGPETWLSPEIDNAELLLNDYNIYRKDRTGKRGGGVLVAVKKCIESEQIQNAKDGNNNMDIDSV